MAMNELWSGTKTLPAVPGFETEYKGNYTWYNESIGIGRRNKEAPGLVTGRKDLYAPEIKKKERPIEEVDTDFHSDLYPGIHIETVVRKDERGNYMYPLETTTTKPYGRKMRYDKSHPQLMYGTHWTSDLTDHPATYSFPSKTGIPPEIPFRRDFEWRAEGRVGNWPTEGWKNWTKVAMCPTYDGHDDQVEYSKYKTQVP